MRPSATSRRSGPRRVPPLHHPVFCFKDRDPHNPYPSGAGAPDGTNLVPGITRTFKGNQKAVDGSCQSYFEYTVTYSRRWYPYL